MTVFVPVLITGKTNKGLLYRLLMLLILIVGGCNSTEQEIEIASHNGHLQMLRIGGLALSPSFEITQKHYVSTAAYSVDKISLQAWTSDQDDKVSVNGQLLEDKEDYKLAVGSNRFTIIVTCKDGVEEHYQLTVTRLSETISID